MDVGFLRDKKVRLLRAEFGASSVLFVLYVFCKVFEGDGYFLKWDKDECLIASGELGESPTYISEVLQGCLSRSLFDQGVFQVFGVLTSAGIQRRYLRGCEKRDVIQMATEYFLLNVQDREDVAAGTRAKLTFFRVSGEETMVNSPGNNVSSPDNPQSKVKESKVKESKVKKSKEDGGSPPAASPPAFILFPLNTGEDHPIYPAQVEEWSGLYPAVDVAQELREMRGWLLSNPGKRKTKRGVSGFITNWLSREQDKGPRGQSKAQGRQPQNASSGNVFMDMLEGRE